MWRGGRGGAHPVLMLQGSGAEVEHTYRTRGTSSDRNVVTDATLYRIGYLGRVGFMADWLRSDTYGGGSSTDTVDLFGFFNQPLWPNRRLRFHSRPGFYYKRTNIQNGTSGDVEPRTWGFRFEGEMEVDIIKRPKFVLSIFGNGRVGWGWGYAHVSGGTTDVREFEFGWEAGIRAHLSNFFAAVSYIERTDEIDGYARFRSAEYGVNGVNLSFGLRW